MLRTGSGTGLAGICAALLFKPRKTILTDLDDALELLRSNARLNSTSASIEIQELDWNECATVRSSLPERIDTILLSDVLYNQEKHDVLLEALDLLATPNTQVLLAAKERHVDERVFWEKIRGKWTAKLLYRVLSSEIYELQKLQ
jgi:predicted nicotinamide N-methyase